MGEAMKDKQWVQHMSGQGEKWAVYYESAHEYQVHANRDVINEFRFHFLPKSEFTLCSPPEVWIDVTGECATGNMRISGDDGWTAIYHKGEDNVLWRGNGYRLRKVQMESPHDCSKKELVSEQWAFIVEKKVS